MKSVWVFSGSGAQFPSAVFSELNLAEEWIRTHELSGTLTEYPLDISVYDLHVKTGLFKIKKDEQRSKEFIQKFSSASQDHFHYENGEK